jgi:hypothetical protein
VTPNPGSIYTGNTVRTRQSPLYDSFSVATATTLNAAGLIKMFGNIDGLNGVGPDTTNMQKAFELQGGTSFLVRSMRCVFIAAAADIASFCQKWTVRLIAGGIRELDAPADYWPGGAGVAGSAANGVNDPRAIVGFDLDPILLTDGISFRVELVGTTFTTTAAFFMRVYLDGRITEPV